jgi:hypothetical protein
MTFGQGVSTKSEMDELYREQPVPKPLDEMFRRMFNPARQQARFDPDEKYVRRYVPDLGDVDYPDPIVDDASARRERSSTTGSHRPGSEATEFAPRPSSTSGPACDGPAPYPTNSDIAPDWISATVVAMSTSR